METTFKVRDRYTGLYFNNGQWLAEPQLFAAGDAMPDDIARIGYGREIIVHNAPWLVEDITDFERPVQAAPAPVLPVAEGPEDLNDFDGYW